MKKKVYLDHNIIILAESNPKIFDYLCGIKKDYLYYYSPAHIEEIFKKFKSTLVKEQKKRKCTFHDEQLKELMQLYLDIRGYKRVDINYIISLMKCIELLTGNKDILPAFSSLKTINWVMKESTLECFGRASLFDTTSVINKRGKAIYSKAIEIRNKRIDDKTITNIPNLNEIEIWDNHYIKESIELFNRNEIMKYINEANHEIKINNNKLNKEDQILEIRNNFKIKKFLYKEENCSRHEIELAFQILFELLNANGYWKEKDEDKAISSIHDVSHAIYGLYCDIFITCDHNFYKKLLAVYYYLGIEKKVYYCQQKDAYENICKILKSNN